MEPTTQDSERCAGKNKRKWSKRCAGKNKIKWSKIEDEKLIEVLLELVNAGTHKANNGFKPGYLAILEDALLTKLSGSDLKTRPRIESRIKTLKKDFTTVYDMRFGPTSGLVGMIRLMLSLPLTKSGMHISRFMKRLLSGDIIVFMV